MTIQVIYPGGVKVNALIDPFEIATDQPVKDGGEGTAPAPFALFLASLATCAGYYVKAFCDSRHIDTTGIHLTMDTVHDPVKKRVGKFLIQIHVPDDFPEKYDTALVHAASVCAVKRHLSEDIVHEITVARGTQG